MITGPDGEDVIAIRSVCYLPLTYDHRLVDGADAGRFVSAIRARLEEGAFEAEPARMTLVARRRHRAHRASRARDAGLGEDRRVRVLVAGSSGLIGTALVAHLRAAGHEVLRLVRRAPAAPDERGWDPPAGRIDEGTFDGVDAVVNLNGVGIGDRPWSGARKQLIRDSRNVPTEVLAAGRRRARRAGAAQRVGHQLLRRHRLRGWSTRPPRTGAGFLAEVCRDWEAATAPAAAARGPGGAAALGRGALPGRRRARSAAAAVPARAGRPARLRCAVLPVDLAGRRGRRDPVPAEHDERRRPGQPGRARAGHQRRVHPGAGRGGPPAGAVRGPRVRAQDRARADGRGDGAAPARGPEPARAARGRLPVPAPSRLREALLRGGRAS